MPDLRTRITSLLETTAKMTEGPWEADCSGSRSAESAQCSAVNADGQTIFDTLNRDYRLSLVDSEVDEDDQRWYDIAGKPDIEGAVALRNEFPAMGELLLALLDERTARGLVNVPLLAMERLAAGLRGRRAADEGRVSAVR